jgi:hypothetical protein
LLKLSGSALNARISTLNALRFAHSTQRLAQLAAS